jgi:tetratricopeptide (TPR) repeat protein
VLALLLALLAACDPPGEYTATGDRIPLIRNEGEFSVILQEAQRLSEGPLRRFDQGEELSEQDRKDLRKASASFQGLIAFKPSAFGPRFGAAKVFHALGDRQRAGEQFERALMNQPQQPTPEHVVLIAEAHDSLARLLMLENRDELAAEHSEKAMALFPDNAEYWTTRAEIELNHDHVDQAKGYLSKALELDPDNRRAQRLVKLINLPDEGGE